jgi:hypothetical protein
VLEREERRRRWRTNDGLYLVSPDELLGHAQQCKTEELGAKPVWGSRPVPID